MIGGAVRIARGAIVRGHSEWVRGLATGVNRLPARRLQSHEERLQFLRDAERAFGVTDPEHWRKVRQGDLLRMPGGRSFLKHYGGSLHAALVDLEPDFSLPRFLCMRSIPKEYWSERQNAREYFDYTAKKLHVREPEDWASVPGSRLWKDCGYGLVKEHGSMTAALQFAYPEVEPSRFLNRRCKPKGHWNSPESRRAFVLMMAEEMGLSEPEDWKRVSVRDFRERGGSGLLARYNNSVIRMLEDVLPEHRWEAQHCRERMPLRYWDDKSNRKAFLDEAGKRLGVARLSDWAKVTQGQFLQIRGSKSLLSKGPLLDMLIEAYGGHDLSSFRLRPSTPTWMWQSDTHVRDFLDMVKCELGISEPGDWARVSQAQLRQIPGGSSFVSCGISLKGVLKNAYPHEQWGSVDWQDGLTKRAAQYHFKMTVAGIFGYASPTYLSRSL